MASCTGNLPPIKFDNCNPKVAFGQIKKVYLRKIGNPFTDVLDLEEWTEALDETTILGTEIREFTVIGDKPAPGKSEIKISGGRTVYGPKQHSINIKIDDLSAENYAFMQAVEGGSRTFLMWYEDNAGFIYGGNDGISATVDFDHIIPEDSGGLQTLTGVAKWEESVHPDRGLSPMAV